MFEALIKAAAFGKTACETGIHRATALDSRFLPLLRGLTPKESMRAMDAWYKAWDKANLSSDE